MWNCFFFHLFGWFIATMGPSPCNLFSELSGVLENSSALLTHSQPAPQGTVRCGWLPAPLLTLLGTVAPQLALLSPPHPQRPMVMYVWVWWRKRQGVSRNPVSPYIILPFKKFQSHPMEISKNIPFHSVFRIYSLHKARLGWKPDLGNRYYDKLRILW